jgi:Asp-tRNA(Asn)/Glu-tRNA(Gln) amidotransferase A subunit family amidase
LLSLDAAQLRAAYAETSISPMDVIKAVLAAAELARDTFAAITSINQNDALAAAAASEARWRAHAPLSRLDGVPMTFKDSFNIRGLPRWHGSAVSLGSVSETDAAPVRRAREAGIVIAAKTSMPDYGLLMSGLSSHTGITRNPWDPATNTAGSSAGAAACLACGVAPLALGTDMVGSVRLPAAMCGLASLHATQGRVAYDPPGNYRGAGPMARTIADVTALLEVVGQYDPVDHFALPGSFVADDRSVERLDGMKIGVLSGLSYGDRVDAPTAQAVSAQADVLCTLGAEIVPLADLDVTQEDYEAIYWTMVHKGLGEFFAAPASRRGAILPQIGAMLDAALGQSALFVAGQARRLAAATARVRKQLETFDFILSPALPKHRFPAEAISPGPDMGAMSHMGFACWFNQLGCPAGTAPVARAAESACPVSVQLVGRRFDDAGVLRLLRHLEHARGFDITFPVLSLS